MGDPASNPADPGLRGFISALFTECGVLSRVQSGECINATRRSWQQSNFAMVEHPSGRAGERLAAGQLALELMHEIRNPLEALSHLTYLAREEADDVEKVRHYMSLAEEHIYTLNQLASQTLGFARSSSSPRPSDLVQLAEAALRIHQRAIDSKKIHLVKYLPENLIAEVHTGQLLQVLSNLIVNAVDALPEDGSLSLRLHKHSGRINLLIADNGHGIAVEHRDKLFEPFFTTKEENGNGLGLALSKKIVERHNGKIGLRSSVVPGKSGTTFRICLPA